MAENKLSCEMEYSSKKHRRIGEILLQKDLISKDALEIALECQKVFGGNTTQFLLKYGYIKEEDLACAVTSQYGCPYLSLKSYEVSKYVIDLIPSYIAEKYWLVPVDKMDDVITVVMANPCDQRVIKEIEEITHCHVQPFVGITSEIARAIQHYYSIDIENKMLERERKIAPLFVREKSYKGMERRQMQRIDIDIPIRFADQDIYRNVKTKELSRTGLSFESAEELPVGSMIRIRIGVPADIGDDPIDALVQVMRSIPLEHEGFDIGVKIVHMRKEDVERIVKYALTENAPLKKERKARPLFIWKISYKGMERRKAARIRAAISLQYTKLSVCVYRNVRTKDISRNGLLFKSTEMLPMGAIIGLKIDLPKEAGHTTLDAVVQVVRAVPLAHHGFNIGVKIVHMIRDDSDIFINYALRTILKRQPLSTIP